MFTISNRIIVVDNSEDDLRRIATEFNNKGVGCRTILYDGITFPPEPFVDVRIAFFDVNLATSFSDNDTFAILENAIKSYISPENGPYALIFWTNKTAWKDDFIQYINRDQSQNNIVREKLKPYHISIIDKTSISEKNPLETILKQELTNPMVELCLSFDNQLRQAADNTINNLLSLIEIGENWGRPTQFEENCKKLFTKIAITAHGLNNAKQNPDSAINDSVIPIIAHSLPQNTLWQNFLNQYIQSIETEKDIILNDDSSLKKLNNFFLIDKRITQKEMRGAIVKLNVELFSRYFNIEFLDWVKNQFAKKNKEIAGDIYPIAVEISAACDYCQQKNRNHKYLMGIASSSKIPDNKKLNIYHTDGFFYQDQDLYMAFDFNYIFIDNSPSIVETTLFGFRKEMVDLLGNKYANHVARIGITSFK